MPSYYEVLGVEPDADQSRIRDAYAQAVRAAPPAEAGAETRDRRLDEAYAVVGDPDRRRRYDALRLSEGSGGNAELLSLLSVIADLGAIPTADEVLGRPGGPAPAEPPAAGGLRAVGPAPTTRGQPTREQPTRGQPTRGQPTRGQPTRQQPTRRQPTRQQPTRQQPTRGEPRSGAAPAAGSGHAGSPRRTPPSRPATAGAPARAPAKPTRPVPGTDGDEQQLARRRTLVGVVLAGLLVGVGAGLLYAGQQTPELALEEGACVTLGESEAVVARCDDPAAGARIVQVVDDAAECPPSPLGSLSLPEGTACLTEVDPVGG